ncbi:anti-phage deoxyguanosine triphosphatase [Devosia sp. MC521]|uniref:anti-phage deoxyguanosine triphosphatase n=1 Tax=Devosia sp. MC521 TaxID=2759954 RepID=UPI0015F930EF|nr:anti-phage deoxyguanosine triphosphatase [Devosia sp. MC521]MBJ6988481.1 dGTPase [Devosia sp. MC521]QMW62525.1 dGTPase [Devosia sp. MC521]
MSEAGAVWFERREATDAQTDDIRLPEEIDYARVVHSASFRRLQGKTQVLGLGDGDFYRTRLTHSLEVAQIAGGITRQLAHTYANGPRSQHLPSLIAIQAISALHDLGHPPFGHGGEVALNYCMRDHGGFEGNGQTLRIIGRLEEFSHGAGSNLTRRTVLGILKYPVAYSTAANPELKPALNQGLSTLQLIDRQRSKPPKAYLDSEVDIVGWLIDPLSPAERDAFTSARAKPGKHAEALHKSFDCSIMDVADDISFGVHDFEDALKLRLISEEAFLASVTEDKCASILEALTARYPEEFGTNPYATFVAGLFGRSTLSLKRWIGRIIHHLMARIEIVEHAEFDDPIVKYRAELPAPDRAFVRALKDVVYHNVIRSPSVQQMEFKGQQMVVSVFEAVSSEPQAFLPPDVLKRWQDADENPRIICDYIASMTDGTLMKTYERLFTPRMGSVFDLV